MFFTSDKYDKLTDDKKQKIKLELRQRLKDFNQKDNVVIQDIKRIDQELQKIDPNDDNVPDFMSSSILFKLPQSVYVNSTIANSEEYLELLSNFNFNVNIDNSLYTSETTISCLMDLLKDMEKEDNSNYSMIMIGYFLAFYNVYIRYQLVQLFTINRFCPNLIIPCNKNEKLEYDSWITDCNINDFVCALYIKNAIKNNNHNIDSIIDYIFNNNINYKFADIILYNKKNNTDIFNFKVLTNRNRIDSKGYDSEFNIDNIIYKLLKSLKHNNNYDIVIPVFDYNHWILLIVKRRGNNVTITHAETLGYPVTDIQQNIKKILVDDGLNVKEERITNVNRNNGKNCGRWVLIYLWLHDKYHDLFEKYGAETLIKCIDEDRINLIMQKYFNEFFNKHDNSFSKIRLSDNGELKLDLDLEQKDKDSKVIKSIKILMLI